MPSSWNEQLILAGIRPLRERNSDISQIYDVDVKSVAKELLARVNRLKAPSGFGGFGATSWERMKQVQLLLDVPVQVMDPKRYPDGARENNALERWSVFLKEIDHVLATFRRKYPTVAIQKRRQPDDAESDILARAPTSRLR